MKKEVTKRGVHNEDQLIWGKICRKTNVLEKILHAGFKSPMLQNEIYIRLQFISFLVLLSRFVFGQLNESEIWKYFVLNFSKMFQLRIKITNRAL
jgi:hypothetical protein